MAGRTGQPDRSEDGARRLARELAELYAVPPDEFVAERRRRASELRRDGEPALAAELAAAPTPTAHPSTRPRRHLEPAADPAKPTRRPATVEPDGDATGSGGPSSAASGTAEERQRSAVEERRRKAEEREQAARERQRLRD